MLCFPRDSTAGLTASLFYPSLCCRFRRACPGGSDNCRATPGRYGTPSRSIHGSPSGLSRREHDWRARCVPTQSLLPPGQARRRARYLAQPWLPTSCDPAGTGPAEISQTCVEQRGRKAPVRPFCCWISYAETSSAVTRGKKYGSTQATRHVLRCCLRAEDVSRVLRRVSLD